MGDLSPDLSFQDWLVHVFDHEAGQPQWYFGPDAPYWQGEPPVVVAYLTRFFEDPAPCARGYSDEQLNQGFWYLVGSGGSDHMLALLDQDVPTAARLRCIRSFASVFEKLYAPRCSPHLSYIDEPGAGPLNGSCYMWWDILPIAGRPDDPARREVDDGCLDVMERILALDSIACQESALHGLGHWHQHYPARTERVIDAFVAAHPTLRPEIARYASYARQGCVL